MGACQGLAKPNTQSRPADGLSVREEAVRSLGVWFKQLRKQPLRDQFWVQWRKHFRCELRTG